MLRLVAVPSVVVVVLVLSGCEPPMSWTERDANGVTAGLTDYSGGTAVIGRLYDFTAAVKLFNGTGFLDVTWHGYGWTLHHLRNKPVGECLSSHPQYYGSLPPGQSPPPVDEMPCAYIWHSTVDFGAVHGPATLECDFSAGVSPYRWPACRDKLPPESRRVQLEWFATYKLEPDADAVSTAHASYVVSYQE